MEMLLTLLIISIAINLSMFVVAYLFKTDKLTDISYAVTFVVLSVYGLASSVASFPYIILAAMICIWAFRLGAYLLKRIGRIGKDKRFDGKREKFLPFLQFWLLQGITVGVVMLPSILFFSYGTGKIGIVSIVGVVLWLLGLIIEAIADDQKYKFINDINNKGKWIDIGLWKYSRHPNYFGEILLWVGIYIFTLSGLSVMQGLIGLSGPLYIAVLIIFVSGIPLLEKSAYRKWGENKGYLEYKNQTSILLLLPKRK